MVDTEDERAEVVGFSTSCAGILSVAKILAVGLSLGTGVCGGHFWAPLFTGATASHFFIGVLSWISAQLPGVFGGTISSYPCVALICIMGSTHVVTFRAHLAIMPILTLSIRSFSSGDRNL